MLITFSHPLDRAASYVEQAARRAGVQASIGHVRPHPGGAGPEVRFTLRQLAADSFIMGAEEWIGASVAQHDQVIRQLLELDPLAKVRTARAVYESLEDFETQLAARVS